jgi:type II secretory pathway pseudopilin PulG
MRKRRGFSLIEVLIAVFLVITCMLIVIATMPLATASRAKATLSTRAIGLAQKELEALRGAGYPNLTPTQMYAYGLIDNTTPVTTNTYRFTSADALAYDSPANVLPSGTGTVLVEQLDFDLRRVTITVTYRDRNTTKTVRLGTIIANL